MINDNILLLLDKDPESIMLSVAHRIKRRRLERCWTQKLLASKTGIPISTYRRFELKGEISFHNLVMIAIVLDTEDDFATLFSLRNYQNMDELLNSNKPIKRKRGVKNE